MQIFYRNNKHFFGLCYIVFFFILKNIPEPKTQMSTVVLDRCRNKNMIAIVLAFKPGTQEGLS